MSRIIKSSNVSLGKQMELDNTIVIKHEETNDNDLGKIKEVVKGNVQQPKPKTQEEIEAIYVEEARKKSELFFNEEMQRAYNEGMAKANSDGINIINDATSQAERIMEEAIELKNNISIDYKNTMASMEKDILDLVLEVAKKVIEKEIEKPDYILGVITDAIEKTASKKDTILKVSEDDYEFIMKNKDKLLLNVEGFGDVEIIKESSLEKGSCLIETKFGIIDGGIKTRMKQIEQEVYRILNR